MKSHSKKKKKSALEKQLEIQQKALKKIISALEEKQVSPDTKSVKPLKTKKDEKT